MEFFTNHPDAQEKAKKGATKEVAVAAPAWNPGLAAE
jgi:hypothetical protein